MKVIKYTLRTVVNHGSEEVPQWEEVCSAVELDWNEQNEEIAKREAADGIYRIEDDGTEQIDKPSQEERIGDLEEALALLLSGVTE